MLLLGRLRLSLGNWKLEIGNWKLEIGNASFTRFTGLVRLTRPVISYHWQFLRSVLMHFDDFKEDF